MSIINRSLRRQGENIIFSGNVLDLLISEYYIKSRIAINYGTHIDMFGLCDARLGSTEGVLVIPSLITVYPSEVFDEKIKGEKYTVARFKKNDVLCSINIPKNSTNLDIFMTLLDTGKLPNNLKYPDILKMFLKVFEINDIDPGVDSQSLESIVAEFCRVPGNPDKKLATVLGKDPNMEPHIERTSIRNIVGQNSVFGGITFEYLDGMLTKSVNRKSDQLKSPMEDVIKY